LLKDSKLEISIHAGNIYHKKHQESETKKNACLSKIITWWLHIEVIIQILSGWSTDWTLWQSKMLPSTKRAKSLSYTCQIIIQYWNFM